MTRLRGYDSWKTSIPDYEEAVRLGDDVWGDRIEVTHKMKMAGDFFQGVVDMLYGREEFSKSNLEFYMEELGHYLNVEVKGDLCVKEDRTCKSLEEWKRFNNRYLGGMNENK